MKSERRSRAWPGTKLLGRMHALYVRFVYRLDAHLRRSGGVVEYAHDPEVIFRIGFSRLRHDAVLPDGTCFPCGEMVLDIHLWNERVPEFAATESPIAWGRRMNRGLDRSLAALSRYLADRPELAGIRAIRAGMAFATAEQAAQVLRICARYGFAPVQPVREGLPERLHRLAENVWIGMLILARNPGALRPDVLTRIRTPVIVPRAELERRYPVDATEI